MEKTFNRSTVKEISQKIQEILSEHFKDENYSLSIRGARFSDDLASLNLEVRLKDSDGSIGASEYSHSIADCAASSIGLKLTGHLIGSSWNVEGAIYNVIGYKNKRPRYPLLLSTQENKTVKTSVVFLKRGYQIVAPTLQEFIKWFTMDPDSDAIKESDVEICDKVQEYLEINYPVESGDKFFNIVDKINEKNLAKRWAAPVYDFLFKDYMSIDKVYIKLKEIYKRYEDKKE